MMPARPPSPPPSRGASIGQVPPFSFPCVFLLLAALCSLVVWGALYLPWSAGGQLKILGTALGTYSLDVTATGWSLGAATLGVLNAISLLLWLLNVTKVPSLLLWGLEMCLSLWLLVVTALALVSYPLLIGPRVYDAALAGLFWWNWQLRRRYRIPEEFITPHGEETFKPPF